MKIIVTAQSKEYLHSKGINIDLASFLETYFQNEINNEIKKHLVKSIIKNIDFVNENKRIIIDDIDNLLRMFPIVSKDKVRDMVKNHNVSVEAATHSLGINEEFAVWIAKMIDKKSIIPIEDDEKVKEKLEEFKKLQNSPNVPNEYKDINVYQQFGDLSEAIDTFSGQKSKAQETKDLISSSVSEVYNQEGVRILKISSPEAMTHYAQGTDWCVKDITWAKKYIREDGGPYHLVYLDEKRTSLIHEGSNQIKDPYDRPLNDAVIISRIAPALSQLKIKSKTGDFYEYRSTLEKMEKINNDIKSSPEQKKYFCETLRRNPKQHFLLYKENREDPEISEAIKDGYIDSIRYIEYSDAIDEIPEEYVKYIPQELMNEWVKFYTKDYLDWPDIKQKELDFRESVNYNKILHMPKRIRVNLNQDVINFYMMAVERAIGERVSVYNDLPPDLRVRLSKESINKLETHWLGVLASIPYIGDFFKHGDLPLYFLWNENFIKKSIPIIESLLTKGLTEKMPSQYIAIPEQYMEKINPTIKEECFGRVLEAVRAVLDQNWDRKSDTPDNTPDSELLELFKNLDMDDVKKFLEENDLEYLRSRSWHSFLYEYPEKYDDIKEENEDEDYEYFNSAEVGWKRVIEIDPWQISNIEEEFSQNILENGGLQSLAQSYVDWFIKNPSEINRLNEVEGFYYQEEKWVLYIYTRVIEEIEDYYQVDAIENYFAKILEKQEEAEKQYKSSWVREDRKRELGEIIAQGEEVREARIDQMSPKELLEFFYKVTKNQWNDIVEPLVEIKEEYIDRSFFEHIKTLSYNETISSINSIVNNEITQNEIPVIEVLVKKVFELSNIAYSYNFPPQLKLENILNVIKSGDFANIKTILTELLSRSNFQRGWYASDPWENFGNPPPKDTDTFKRVEHGPWYKFIMKNSKQLKDPQTQEQQVLKKWVLENTPKEVLAFWEIRNILEENQVTSWYKCYKTVTSSRQIKIASRLKDFCEIKTNFPDADFWIQRKGSHESVGTPTNEFSPEHIGVKVIKTNVLDDKYLFYLFSYLHNSGMFKQISKGILNLQHITTQDIKDIPIG